jgi:hypothetical protein
MTFLISTDPPFFCPCTGGDALIFHLPGGGEVSGWCDIPSDNRRACRRNTHSASPVPEIINNLQEFYKKFIWCHGQLKK